MPAVYNRHQPGVPEDAVCIERTTEWGNRFRIKPGMPRGSSIAAFRQWAWSDKEYVARVQRELRGKDLVCVCSPKPCHGDVLLEIANADPLI